MRYRTKLYLSFIFIATVSSLVGLIINQIEVKDYLFAGLVNHEKSIVATLALAIDGDKVKQIQKAEDQNSPTYKELQAQLRQARNANRREDDIFVKYLYLTRPDPADPKKFIFVVDAEEQGKNFSPTGTENPGSSEDVLYDHLQEVYSSNKILMDPWGPLLTAYAPIYDSAGQYVASLGVDVTANFVYSVLDNLIFYALLGFICSIALSFMVAFFLANSVSSALRSLVNAVAEIGQGNFSYRVQIISHDEFSRLGYAINTMAEGLEERERLKTGFTHYVSRHVLDKILKEKSPPKLEGEKKKITVLFADIRGFTHMAESMSPEQVVSLLNEYLSAMIDIILKHNGVLDKLYGDGIMAEFGTIGDDPEQERSAVLAAIEMQRLLIDLRKKWLSEGKPQIHSGIAIHTGDAVVGSIGSEKRMEYTAIGDTVNVASRLQLITKKEEFSIIISEKTLEGLRGEFHTQSLGLQTLPGRELPITAYALLFDASAQT